MIGDGSDPERIAKAVHKAMPLLEMLEPGKNEWLAPLQGVHLSQVHQQSKQAHQQSKHDSLLVHLRQVHPLKTKNVKD